MRQALTLTWLERFAGGRRRKAPPQRLLVPSRDLPPVEARLGLALPRSPDPLSEAELRFARRAASRSAMALARSGRAADSSDICPAPSIATGANLRVLLERFEQVAATNEPQDQLAGAHNWCGAQRERPASLRLVSADPAAPAPKEAASKVDRTVEAALATALDRLRALSDPARR